MLDRRRLLTSAAALTAVATFARARPASADGPPNMRITLVSHFQIMRFVDADTVELLYGKDLKVVRRGDVFNDHTLTAILPGDCVVLEDGRAIDGHMLIVDATGVRYDLIRTAESTAGDYSQGFLGHSQDEVRASPVDLLGDAILAQAGDPQYDAIAAVFPPIRNTDDGIYNFIGSYKAAATIPFAYGGRSPHFDPATGQPALEAIRAAGRVRDGLVGGYLPCLRFVYPEADGAWTELIAFAPFETTSVAAWYRLTRYENAKPGESRYFGKGIDAAADTTAAQDFYRDLVALKTGWDQVLQPAMSLDVPDARLTNMARHSLIRLLMSKSQDGTEALQAWGQSPLATAKLRPSLAPAHGCLLGMPKTEHDDEVATALSGDYAYALIREDHIREALLTTYSTLAHHYTRGMWLATDTRHPLTSEAADGWTATAQSIAPLMIRWLLVFEDPNADILWLGKGMPRHWLENDKLSFIDKAPTRWGRVSFALDSRRQKEHRIAARVTFPKDGIAAETRLRLRAHDAAPIRSVAVNDKGWRQFDAASGTITLPAGMSGEVLVDVRY